MGPPVGMLQINQEQPLRGSKRFQGNFRLQLWLGSSLVRDRTDIDGEVALFEIGFLYANDYA